MFEIGHEVMTPGSVSSTAPIHAFIVDSAGRIRDRASLVGPGTDQATVFGPFFVLPFNTTVVTPPHHHEDH